MYMEKKKQSPLTTAFIILFVYPPTKTHYFIENSQDSANVTSAWCWLGRPAGMYRF